jgi:hypothetical protein
VTLNFLLQAGKRDMKKINFRLSGARFKTRGDGARELQI